MNTGNRLLRSHHDRHEHSRPIGRQRQLALPRRLAPRQTDAGGLISCRRAASDTTAPGAKDSATMRPFSLSLQRRRRPTPFRISTRPSRHRSVNYMVDHICEPIPA